MEKFNNKDLPRLKTLGWSYDDDEDFIYYSIGYKVKYYRDYILWVQLTQEGVQDSLTIFFKKHIYFSDYGEEHVELDLYERAMAYQLSICHADPYGLVKRAELFKTMDLTAILTYLMKKRSIVSLKSTITKRSFIKINTKFF